jgi:hypothetical protein
VRWLVVQTETEIVLVDCLKYESKVVGKVSGSQEKKNKKKGKKKDKGN